MTAETRDPATDDNPSTAAQALAAAGDAQSAQDVGDLDAAANAAMKKLGPRQKSLVERLIYGPKPPAREMQVPVPDPGRSKGVLSEAFDCLEKGRAFTADRKLSDELRESVAREKAYGFTVPLDYGGLGGSYAELSVMEEDMAANGLGALAVEISGELTIGAGSLLAYGSPEQKSTYLPLIAEGQLMAFGLTEVRIGVNAKKVRAYVEEDAETGGYRLFAHGDRNKLWITNATHGALVGIVARIGKGGKQVGLFVTRLPDHDMAIDELSDHAFSVTPSGVEAFVSNYNSRIHFENFPLPAEARIQGDGVEVLFYCLRMGRCMLAAMSAGYQRMFAADASHYARKRMGVGGPVIKHELPRLALSRVLGGALMSRALSHLSLQQDAEGVDLAGLRDLTKSACATSALESLVATERVLGGRTFDRGSRVSEARPNIHVFGVVEGEDDLILMGMVKDITGSFVDRYLAGLLGALQNVNSDASGKPVAREQRILRITPLTFLKQPGKAISASLQIAGKKSFWALKAWMLGNAVKTTLALPFRLIPTFMMPRYSSLPPRLRRYARYAERMLARQRWAYLGINMFYQLELTRSQIPLQRYGKRIEHLVSMLAVCHYAVGKDESIQHIAEFQAEQLKQKAEAVRLVRGIPGMERLRKQVAAVGRDIEKEQCTLISDVKPQPYAHPWDEGDD